MLLHTNPSPVNHIMYTVGLKTKYRRVEKYLYPMSDEFTPVSQSRVTIHFILYNKSERFAIITSMRIVRITRICDKADNRRITINYVPINVRVPEISTYRQCVESGWSNLLWFAGQFTLY
jgi:hypothetical protein